MLKWFHTHPCAHSLYVFLSLLLHCVALNLTSEMQKLRPKAKWLTQSRTMIAEMKLWFKSKRVPFWWQHSTFVPQSPASPWYLLSIRWKHVWFLLPLGRQNQKASLALLGMTVHRMSAAGSFPLNSMHIAQIPPEVWLLVVRYLVLSQLWSSEQIASPSPGRENILQHRIIQIRHTRLLHPVKTDCGELGLIQCKY